MLSVKKIKNNFLETIKSLTRIEESKTLSCKSSLEKVICFVS